MLGDRSPTTEKRASQNGAIVLIDNHDSFVFNLDHCVRQCGIETIVRRNDAVTLAEIGAMAPAGIIISPGPGWPERAGISVSVIREFAGVTPILGVCLGHQAIAEAFGGGNRQSGAPRHGKTSAIQHDGRTIFAGLPSPFEAMRYHSLVVERATLPECLHVSAWTPNGLIMGLRHRTLAVEGVQFHPESILTDYGQRLIENFAATVRHMSSRQ